MSSPDVQLRRMVKDGTDPETAAHTVLIESFGDEILSSLDIAVFRWLERLVTDAARKIESQEGNRAAKRALGHKGLTPGSSKFAAADAKIRRMVYHTADGARVLWDDMSSAEIREKIAMLRKQVGSLAGHLVILEAARDLLAERGAARLSEVPDWPSLVRKMTEERGGTPAWMYLVAGEDEAAA